MNSKLSWFPAQPPHGTKHVGQRTSIVALLAFAAGMLAATPRAIAADAPGWMRALVNAPLPAHDEKTDAVRLYSEEILTVQPNGKIKTLEREAYKILRPGGKVYGSVRASYDSETRITSIKGWCIPAQGKDYEVKEKDAMETSLYGVEDSELVTDVRTKLLQIPAADPGNIVGYEIDHEDRPYILQDEWIFQSSVPTREARYTLQLPPGWEYKAVWLNHPEVFPAATGNNQWQWMISDVKAVEPEGEMPPWQSVAGQMIVSFLPAGGGGQKKGFESWGEVGSWYLELTRGRRDASPEIKQKVAALTASALAPLAKMQALARFLQQDIRYVAIELGIGGLQPHPAVEVFTKRYGDCKDKATLMSSMLKEIGVDSFYIVINTKRGAVTPATPPHLGGFNHVILAIQLADGINDSSLVAVMQHPKLGKILFFDPTDDLTPFGRLRGPLQANYGMLVMPEGGELTELPQLSPAMNAINRTAKLKLDANGTLQGEVKETRLGDPASYQRYALRAATKDADKIKPIETLLAHSFATFQVTKATVTSLDSTNLPFEYNYTIVSQNYAKLAGNLLLVRPRVLGSKATDLLETKEPRRYPVEFDGPERDTDDFEITLPAGYEVEDLPPPVDAEYSFANYRSKAEANGGVLRYTRTLEVKEISVPLSKVEELKKLYRVIANDERNAAVLRPTVH
jgi:hypothetical protein